MVSYGVESELGQLETTAHKVVSGSKVAFDARSDLYEETTSRERFKSDNFRELELDFAIGMTVRKAASRLNRIRREIGGIIITTLRNNVEREGMTIYNQKEALAERALLANGFTVDAELIQPENFVSDEPKHIAAEQLSMIMYGSKLRNAFLERLLPCLWFGNVTGAIKSPKTQRYELE